MRACFRVDRFVCFSFKEPSCRASRPSHHLEISSAPNTNGPAQRPGRGIRRATSTSGGTADWSWCDIGATLVTALCADGGETHPVEHTANQAATHGADHKAAVAPHRGADGLATAALPLLLVLAVDQPSGGGKGRGIR